MKELWCVVILSNGVVLGVEGPFESSKEAHDWTDPRNETQKGAIVGEVHQVKGQRDW